MRGWALTDKSSRGNIRAVCESAVLANVPSFRCWGSTDSNKKSWLSSVRVALQGRTFEGKFGTGETSAKTSPPRSSRVKFLFFSLLLGVKFW